MCVWVYRKTWWLFSSSFFFVRLPSLLVEGNWTHLTLHVRDMRTEKREKNSWAKNIVFRLQVMRLILCQFHMNQKKNNPLYTTYHQWCTQCLYYYYYFTFETWFIFCCCVLCLLLFRILDCTSLCNINCHTQMLKIIFKCNMENCCLRLLHII